LAGETAPLQAPPREQDAQKANIIEYGGAARWAQRTIAQQRADKLQHSNTQCVQA